MKKIISILIIISFISFIPLVKAEENIEQMGIDTKIIEDLITQKNTEDDNNTAELFNTYDIYYLYEKIDDTTYEEYLKETFEQEENGALGKINALVPTITSVEQLSSWIKVDTPQFVYPNIEYNKEKKTGYIISVAAVSKQDQSKIYVHRGVYETINPGTLENSYAVNYKNYQNTNTNNETVTEENPNTGIGDYAIYLVPIALVSGAALMMRKNYA